MYDTEGNKDQISIHDNFFNCRQPHQHIHLKEKKQVLKKKNPLIENLSCFKHQINMTVVCYCPVLWKFLPLVIGILSELSIDSTVAFSCKTSTFR